MNRISLCMIVQNEEQFIAQCLQSAVDLVDEIIIVDTGSTDRTLEICKSFGAKIYSFSWNDNFSEARNAALSYAHGEWILVLDADDELSISTHDFIRDLLNQKSYDAFFFITKNLVGDPKNPSFLNYAQLRLFRNQPSFRYSGAIHERIPKLPNITYQLVPVMITHYGYLDSVVQAHHKVERNLAILHAELQTKPFDRFLHYYSGNEWLRSGQPNAAIEHYEQAMRSKTESEEQDWLPDLPLKYAFALWQTGQIGRAILVVLKAIKEFPEYTDLYFLLGNMYLEQQEWELAKEAFDRCLHLGEPSPVFPTQAGCGTYLPAFLLGVIEFTNRNWTNARIYFEQSVHDDPDYLPAVTYLCLCDWCEARYSLVNERIQFLRVQNGDKNSLWGLIYSINQSLMTKKIYIDLDNLTHTTSFFTCLATLTSCEGQVQRLGQLLLQLPIQWHRLAMREEWYYALYGKYHLMSCTTLREIRR
ncbi:glycosyltransferase [Sulfoacidibacillus thermotolerans]|uniref:Glycosyltransferase 2-like domain-containing protein n=1 Tax=Sulfoacidibacillus thermotolerans TaxID=1765684 RepID=A0A2U3D9A3_SULT2|nr:glycosyltransferase [Sulfoacidibacillus thermotolerans]PWI57859.1 hypothetical protein BM613_06665 [Sulfoacidibacillus thermotolerans]